MKIGVLIKAVPDTEARIRTGADGTGIDETDVKFVPNPYDEYAYEEALKLHEKIGAGEVVALSVGGASASEILKKNCLAVGCHRGIHVKAAGSLDAVQTAELIAQVVRAEGFEILFAGRQAIDLDQGQVAIHVAEKLGWPVVPAIVAFAVAEDRKSAVVERQSDLGRESLTVPLPAVLTATKGLNEPRYASLKGIMAAKKKPCGELDAAGMTLPAATVRIEKLATPPGRKPPRKVEGDFPANVAALVGLLREEAKVI